MRWPSGVSNVGNAGMTKMGKLGIQRGHVLGGTTGAGAGGRIGTGCGANGTGTGFGLCRLHLLQFIKVWWVAPSGDPAPSGGCFRKTQVMRCSLRMSTNGNPGDVKNPATVWPKVKLPWLAGLTQNAMRKPSLVSLFWQAVTREGFKQCETWEGFTARQIALHWQF